MALRASSFVGTLQPTRAPTVMYMLSRCLARSYGQRRGLRRGPWFEPHQAGSSSTRGRDSERPASGVAAASGPELGRNLKLAVPAPAPAWQAARVARPLRVPCGAMMMWPPPAGPGSVGPRRHGHWHAGRADRPCRLGGACQLRAWGKGQGAWAAWAVRSAEVTSLAGRVSLGLGRSPDSEHEIRPQWQSPHLHLMLRLPQLALWPPTRGHATVHIVTVTESIRPGLQRARSGNFHRKHQRKDV